MTNLSAYDTSFLSNSSVPCVSGQKYTVQGLITIQCTSGSANDIFYAQFNNNGTFNNFSTVLTNSGNQHIQQLAYQYQDVWGFTGSAGVALGVAVDSGATASHYSLLAGSMTIISGWT